MVDQKGRLKIPVTLFPMLKRSGTELYVTSEDGYSVRIYPMQVWNQVEERLERLCSRNRNNQKLLVRKIFRPGCDDGQAGQGADSDRFAEQCAHEWCGGYIRLSELSGSLEPRPIPKRSEKQSNYSAGREDAEHTVLRPTISLDSRLEEQERTCPWKRMAIPGAPSTAQGFRQSTEPRDSRCSNRSGRARAWPDLARSPMKMH